MRFRNTLLVVLVFLLLGGYAYFVELKGKSGAEESTSRPAPLWEIAAADVQRLDVSGPDGSTRLVRNDDGTWRLVNPTTGEEEPADSARVNRVVDSLARLRVLRALTNTVDLAEYGLASPAWQATIELQSGEEKMLQWGDQTPQGVSYYVKKGGEDTVYIVSGFTIEELERLVREPAYEPTPTPTPTATAAPTEAATVTPAANQE